VQEQPADKEMAFSKPLPSFNELKFMLRNWQRNLSVLHAKNAKHVGLRVGSVPDKLW